MPMCVFARMRIRRSSDPAHIHSIPRGFPHTDSRSHASPARPPGFVFPKPISVIFHIFVYTKCAPTVVLVVLLDGFRFSSCCLQAPPGYFHGGYEPSQLQKSNIDVLRIISYNLFCYSCYIHCSSNFNWWSCSHWFCWLSTNSFMMYGSFYSHFDYFSIPALS